MQQKHRDLGNLSLIRVPLGLIITLQWANAKCKIKRTSVGRELYIHPGALQRLNRECGSNRLLRFNCFSGPRTSARGCTRATITASWLERELRVHVRPEVVAKLADLLHRPLARTRWSTRSGPKRFPSSVNFDAQLYIPSLAQRPPTRLTTRRQRYILRSTVFSLC